MFFVRGWVGNANGEKYEAFFRHVLKPYHSRCHEPFQNSIGQLKNGIFTGGESMVIQNFRNFDLEQCIQRAAFHTRYLLYVDTWGSDKQRRSRIPSNLLEVINSFLLQQKPPISVTSFQMLNVPPQQGGCCIYEFARRLSEHTTSFFSMQYFEPSFLLRIKQAKEMLDFVLGI